MELRSQSNPTSTIIIVTDRHHQGWVELTSLYIYIGIWETLPSHFLAVLLMLGHGSSIEPETP